MYVGESVRFPTCFGQQLSLCRVYVRVYPLNMNGQVEDISVRSFCVVKRIRKSVSLEMKLRIIELAGSGESNTEIARKLELPRTTVVTILKDKARILETIECQAPMHTKYIRRQGKDSTLNCNYCVMSILVQIFILRTALKYTSSTLRLCSAEELRYSVIR